MELNDRLAPIRKQYPDLTFPQIVHKAYLERVNLSAQAFFAVPEVGRTIKHGTYRISTQNF